MLYGCKLNLTHATKHINNIQQPFVYGWYPEKKLLFFWILSKLPPPPLPQIWTTCTTFSDVEIQDLKDTICKYILLYICRS